MEAIWKRCARCTTCTWSVLLNGACCWAILEKYRRRRSFCFVCFVKKRNIYIYIKLKLSSWAQRPRGFSFCGEQSWFYREIWLKACTSSNILWQPVWSHKFSTDRLKIFKCTWIKYLLETNFASCAKTTNIRSVHFTYVCFRWQVEKVKIYPDIPYVLPKSYSKLAADRPTVSENVKTVECQVSEEPASTMGFSERC